MNPMYDELSTVDFWSLEEQLGDILQEKGYGLINFDLTYNRQGKLAPCMAVNTRIAEKLANEIRKHGFSVEIKQHMRKRRFSFIFIKNTYPVELLHVVESFEVIV